MNDSTMTRRALLKTAAGAGLASLLSGGRLLAASAKKPKPGGHGPVADSAYSKQVIALRPAGYWHLGEKRGPTAFDASGHGYDGSYQGTPQFDQKGAILHDSNGAVGLDGTSSIEIPSRPEFSVGPKGLTVEAWVQPDRLDFAGEGDLPYVHWLGKGETDHFEWGFRFYKKDSDRPNRISAYIWNAKGDLGAGAYFEEPVTPGQWIHVVAVYEPPSENAGVLIYRDGVFKKGPPEKGTLYRTFDVTPKRGPAPLRLGTRDGKSFLTGGLDEVAIYPRVLTAEEILKNYRTAAGAAAKG